MTYEPAPVPFDDQGMLPGLAVLGDQDAYFDLVVPDFLVPCRVDVEGVEAIFLSGSAWDRGHHARFGSREGGGGANGGGGRGAVNRGKI